MIARLAKKTESTMYNKHVPKVTTKKKINHMTHVLCLRNANIINNFRHNSLLDTIACSKIYHREPKMLYIPSNRKQAICWLLQAINLESMLCAQLSEIFPI